MALSTTNKVAIGAGAGATGGFAAAAVAAAMLITPQWEGMDAVARRDMIGTGHPVTYCYGQTDEFGTVKVGTRFTKVECDAKLAESLPRYWAKIEPCFTVDLSKVPGKVLGSFLDASYNAGAAAVCRSPMMRKINAGDLRGACEAFDGWRVTGAGKVRPGLIKRRGPGDYRMSERQLCLEGVAEATTKRWWQR
ncbi:glycoside hydrolase family protein [Rhodopseudomonas sp. BR0G17]|uniref:glycoside hydrolase family protein n=1 Tax=Rhodopseudomonas sp. BR0G17 TaxID=2269368 RepID=UPI0013E0CCBD|nr:glycoside hydrolase family protein [Rhodopseudomonas sp. BR0G17]NEW95494.1 lysozyme [Rhodopseudomonas sp. BR0G17]